MKFSIKYFEIHLLSHTFADIFLQITKRCFFVKDVFIYEERF